MRNLFILLVIFGFTTGSIYGQGWEVNKGQLVTKWAEEVNPDRVWQQYPRPQLQRTEWVNLNGLWDYKIAAKDESKPQSYDGKILVPFPVESALSGVKKRVGSEGRIWYKTEFSIADDWNSPFIALHFEAVDWETDVWLNGKKIGVHRGGYDHFKFVIPKSEFKEINTLVIGVTDPTDQSWQALGKQVEKPGGIFYTSVTGIWQTVWLEPLNEIYLESFKIHGEIDETLIRLVPNVSGPKDKVEMGVKAYFKGKLVGEYKGSVKGEIEIPLSEEHLWSPDSPDLYDLEIELSKKGRAIDKVRSYFGLRSLKLDQAPDGFQRLFLNNQPVFHNGPLDQGYWPDGLYTPPTEEAMLYDLEVTKKLGFNMLRKHVKIESRRFYYLCDKIGLMVWQDMPNGDRKIGPREADIIRSPESAKQFEFELRRMIEDRYNHPSIVMWVPFNEGWGQYDTERIANLVKKLDPTRLVNSVSGWADRGVGDVHDIHNYPQPASPEPEKNRAVVLGEFGGLGLPVENHTWEEKNWGYSNLSSSGQLLNQYEAYYTRVWELEKEKGLAAAVYTQITDVETETNGLMTYDREVIKVPVGDIYKININDYIPTARIVPAGGKIYFKDPVKLKFDKKFTARYTLDGSEPNQNSSIYTAPIHMESDFELKVKLFTGKEEGRTVVEKFDVTRNKKPQYKNLYELKYSAGGDYALIDGVIGEEDFRKGWQGFLGKDIEIILDLESEKLIEKVKTGFIQHQGHWIFFPEEVSISVSMDGKDFTEVKKYHIELKPSTIENEIKRFEFDVKEKVRFIKLVAKNMAQCPDWHHCKGEKAWLFIDEIEIK